MSMSTRVYGFKPPDAQWKKMKAVWDSCSAAGVDIPEDVLAYFEYETPDPQGVCLRLDDVAYVREYTDDMQSGFEVDLHDVPKDIKVIRFVNSW